MALSADQIVAKFPYKSFHVIKCEPDYQSIHDIWNLLYVNPPTLTTKLGGGNHGHIGIVMQYTLYVKISYMPYGAPVDLLGTATVTLQ